MHLHAIPQGVWDCVQDVGGAHEEHFGQVDGHVQVVVQEAGVLLRVQQLQQRAGRVALVPWARGSQSALQLWQSIKDQMVGCVSLCRPLGQ